MSALAVDSVEIETLVYERLDGRDRGWRVELLVEQLTNKLEQKFLLCGCCSGLMRDACLLEKEGKQELRCFVCIPEGVTWQPAQMNRDAINEKIIRCPLKERGCNWTKNVSTVIQHLNDCGKEDRRKKTLRLEGNLSTGGKELRCEFCGRGVRACEMNPHLGECSEFPVDCPNGCEVAEETGTRQVKRGDVPLHLTSCPLQTVKCPYWDYGCGEEMERRQLDLHERDSMHTHFILAMKGMKEEVSVLEREVIAWESEIESGKNKIMELKRKISTILSSGKLQWKINGVKQKIENMEISFSDTIYVGPYQCQGYIDWNCSNTGTIRCGIRIMEGSFRTKLLWPFSYEFKFILVSIEPNSDYIFSSLVKRDNLHEYPSCFSNTGTTQKGGHFKGIPFISKAELLGKIFCVDDTINIDIYVEQLPTY